ncbi:MAG TPA: 4Fe-4S binding protein, partial [Syntrophomonadaceae bacterium]|nr:4Fe-4S binding protein [Syntrophomonadaceae bacterium]
INDSKCIQCKMCVTACPFGNTHYDAGTGKILKCDLCGGDPSCAKFCPNGAITYKDAVTATIKKKRAYAEKFKELLQEVSE